MAVWVNGRWEQAGNPFAMVGHVAVASLSPAEWAEYERLAAWFLTWQPPAAPYALGPYLTVSNPQLSHAFRSERIQEGITGQQQRAMLVWLRAHWQIFGGDK